MMGPGKSSLAHNGRAPYNRHRITTLSPGRRRGLLDPNYSAGPRALPLRMGPNQMGPVEFSNIQKYSSGRRSGAPMSWGSRDPVVGNTGIVEPAGTGPRDLGFTCAALVTGLGLYYTFNPRL